MCHTLLADSRFFDFLLSIDQQIATEVHSGGCPHCGGALHVSCYPRKPRGVRFPLSEALQMRLSFCCAEENCRRRCTPPSVRFLGRKVYLSVIVILATAMHHGLTSKRRKQLIEELDLWPQTLGRWRAWWRNYFPTTRCWRSKQGHFIPPVNIRQLPGALLGRLKSPDLLGRLCLLLRLAAPVTTSSWSGSLKVVINPQKM